MMFLYRVSVLCQVNGSFKKVDNNVESETDFHRTLCTN